MFVDRPYARVPRLQIVGLLSASEARHVAASLTPGPLTSDAALRIVQFRTVQCCT
jgi:hypothetical protein